MEKQGFLEFFTSRDVSNLINTGSLLIRNSDWSRRLLTKWIMLRFKEEAINDQSGFDILYREYLDDEDKQKIAILDIREFNSAAPAMTQQGINDKVLLIYLFDFFIFCRLRTYFVASFISFFI